MNLELYLEVENEAINLVNRVIEKTGHDEGESEYIITKAFEAAWEDFYERYYK